ncbi:MAG: phosphoglucosamine mutase [Planctomycetota bacterium]|nr:phosphoglucosamine mutase [Planctomycetota bacterium]
MDRLMVSVSGVRGIVGMALTPQVACDFGCAFGTMLGADAAAGSEDGVTVVCGRDTRSSGQGIRNAVAAGLLATGVDVIDLGVVSTPGVGLMARELGADGGFVVTASHNPVQYNGIKFLQAGGTALTAEQVGRLEAIRRSRGFALSGATQAGSESRNGKTHGRHVDAVCKLVDTLGISSARFKVVLDSINGAGSVVTPMLLGRLGCEVAHLNAEPTGLFAHQPEPTAEHLADLCRQVRKHRAAVGFAQDADADRLAIVDERGEYIGEEYTLALATAFVLRHRKGKVVTNLMTSRMIDDIAAAAGCQVVRTPTGEANVVAAMQDGQCIFGGEGGGGVIEPRVVFIRDSLVGIAYVLQYMAETHKTVSELVAEIPRYVIVKTKLPCPAGAAGRVSSAVRESFASRAGAEFNDADGLRVDLPVGWVCVRASNTEPVIRIFAEAGCSNEAEALIDQVRRIAGTVIGDDAEA